MALLLCMAMVVALLGLGLLTGHWRVLLTPFCIHPDKMTVARLGLHVSPAHAPRVDTILGTFAGGFNHALRTPRLTDVQRYCDAQPTLYQPFAEEGVAMGYTPRHLMRFDPVEFERKLVKARPGFRYLYYVGLGFWSGMRNHAPGRLDAIVQGLDPLHRFLCYDGYGFKLAFFDHPRSASALERLQQFTGYARHAAYQGVGRALWFRFMDDWPALISSVTALKQHAADAAAGVGLAATFVNPDRLETPMELARHMPGAWHPHLHLGMCFALKARAINDIAQFERDMERLPEAVRAACLASIRECDRIELQVRADHEPEKYRRWREQVTRWMSDQIEFPLTGIRPANKRAMAERLRSTPGTAIFQERCSDGQISIRPA